MLPPPPPPTLPAGEAVAFLKSFNVPMLVTGGGGYTKRNVARWVRGARGVAAVGGWWWWWWW